MYIPKNRIVTDLFTNGNEYALSTTKEAYTGAYYKTYEGKFFTGKNPNDLPTIELIPLSKIAEPQLYNSSNPSAFSAFAFDGNSVTYLTLKKEKYEDLKQVPSVYFPQPTSDDYKLGEFQRYFAIKINEPAYTEINKDTYDKLSAKDDMWLWQLYNVIKLPWELVGEAKTVFTTNKNIVVQTEQRNKIAGLGAYLKNDYLKFYKYEPKNNLFTQGGELIDGEGQSYIGPYHIEIDKGYIEGAIPEPRQRRLFLKELYASKKRTT